MTNLQQYFPEVEEYKTKELGKFATKYWEEIIEVKDELDLKRVGTTINELLDVCQIAHSIAYSIDYEIKYDNIKPRHTNYANLLHYKDILVNYAMSKKVVKIHLQEKLAQEIFEVAWLMIQRIGKNKSGPIKKKLEDHRKKILGYCRDRNYTLTEKVS